MTIYFVKEDFNVFGRCSDTFTLKAFSSKDAALNMVKSFNPNKEEHADRKWEEVLMNDFQVPYCCSTDEYRMFVAGRYVYKDLFPEDPFYKNVREYDLAIYIQKMEVEE